MARSISRLLILSLTLASWLNAQERPVAFVDVNAVPMGEEQVLAHQTVVVAGGRITQVGSVGSSSSATVPRDALKIDASGKFLMPGLTDMHAHFMRLVSEKPNMTSSRLFLVQISTDTILSFGG